MEKEAEKLQINIENFYKDLVNGINEFSKLVLKNATVKSLNLAKCKDKKFVEKTKSLAINKKRNDNVEYLNNFINPVLNICLQTKPKRGDSTIRYFEEIYSSTRNLISSNLTLVYYSKTKVNALWDLQIIFPDIFKVNSYISIVSEKNDFFQVTSKKNKSMFENIEYNRFFQKTKDLNITKMKETEEKNRKLIDTIQSQKEKNFKAEKIKNSEIIKSQINPKNEILSLSEIPNFTTNVFFKSAVKSKELKLSAITRKKTIEPIRFSELSNLDIISDEDDEFEESEDELNNQVISNLKVNVSDNIQNFEIKKKSFKEREHEFFKNISIFKDYLSLNSCVLSDEIVFDSKQKIMKICQDYREITYINNFCNYILNNSFINKKIKFTDILLLSKVGPGISVNPQGISDSLDVIYITKPKDFEILSSLFFREIMDYSRVLMVFRPMMVRSGLNEAIINILKINGFNIIKRRFVKLDLIDSKFLFHFEGLDENFLDDYSKIMTESEVEIICISKFGGVNN